MRRIARLSQGWALDDGGGWRGLSHTLGEVLAGAPIQTLDARLDGEPLAPVDTQEVWAAGVTYERSLTARAEESREPDVYERVYESDRAELFFKSLAHRVVGHGGCAYVRSDSVWDVPEPEVVLVLDAKGSIFGYTIGDDVSSRSIEGENPLYLPQAKVYEGSCVIGPWIVPASHAEPPFDISMEVVRGGRVAYDGRTSTAKMRRSFEELASWLCAGLRFPSGALLMTGTGLVPPDDFTLRAGDLVRIAVEQLGTLEHRVALWNC